MRTEPLPCAARPERVPRAAGTALAFLLFWLGLLALPGPPVPSCGVAGLVGAPGALPASAAPVAGSAAAALPVFDAEVARGLDEILSADSLEGRKTGQPGGWRAEQFAADRFREWGLRPGIGDTSYFQPYDFVTTQVVGPPDLTFLGAPPGDIHYTYGEDYVVLLYSGFGELTSDVVYAGYGITAPERGHDDYAGLDVNGKIVLAMRGAPRGGGRWDEERQMGYKARTARQHGARGLILCEGDRPLLGTLQEKYFQRDLPAVFAGARVVRELLVGTARSLTDLRAAAEAGRIASFPLHRRVHLLVQGQVLDPGHGRNVVARIPGQDPALRHECVVVGAHLDHLGRDGLGRIYPGADDNASGASVVLEMARALARGAWRPRRTVYLTLFTAEEQGLRGSTWFAEHPPAESIAVMLNMDMVGVGDPFPNLLGADRAPELTRAARALLPDSVRARSDIGGTTPNSDQWPFAERGIPSIFAVTHGEHPDYHQPEDQSWKIRPEVLGEIGRFEMRLLQVTADTSAFRVDRARMARMLVRMGRPLARARYDDGLRALREAAARSAGVVLLALPAEEPLQTEARVARLKRETAVDSSAFRLALSADDVEAQGDRGKVSVVLESRIGEFDLADTTLLEFLRRLGVRAVVPGSTPTAAEARRIAGLGLMLDETELRAPLAGEAHTLVQGRAAAGAHTFALVPAHEARPGEARAGLLAGNEELWRESQRLLQKGWSRDAVMDFLGGNFVRFWRSVPER